MQLTTFIVASLAGVVMAVSHLISESWKELSIEHLFSAREKLYDGAGWGSDGARTGLVNQDYKRERKTERYKRPGRIDGHLARTSMVLHAL